MSALRQHMKFNYKITPDSEDVLESQPMECNGCEADAEIREVHSRSIQITSQLEPKKKNRNGKSLIHYEEENKENQLQIV